MITNRTLLIICAIVTLTVFGCSSGGFTPVGPSTPGGQIPSVNPGPLSVAVSDFSPEGAPLTGSGTLGLFTMNIDPVNLNGELVSMRSVALEDVLESVDITNFMSLAPCSDCAKIHSVSLDVDGHLVVSIGIRHPFPAGDPFKPITGRNRADLHVFNVEGYIISDGTGATSFPGLNKSTGGFKLVNADGYSSYLDSSWDEIFPTEASIHPYITHFDDYSAGNFNASNPMGFESVTNPPPSGNLVMAMGCSEDIKDYVLDIETGQNIQVIYAVSCTYAVSSANKSQRFTPEYRVPQHNKKAASEVMVEVVDNNLTQGDLNSSATLQVKVIDISHGVPVGTALNEMRADSSVSSISVEIPGITLGPVTIPATPSGGTGHDPSDPLIFSGTITNDADAMEGIYTGLVKVLDSYPSGSNQSPLLNGQDGIKRVGPVENPLVGLFAIDEFATYQTFSVSVENVCVAPTDLVYNLELSTIRSSTYEVTGLRLDWDTQVDVTDYNIYRKDPFDPASTFALLDDGVSTDNFFEDNTIQGNQGYEYYVEAIHICGVANVSNHVLALLENAEDNVSTTSVWETECGSFGNASFKLNEWGICTNYAANGTHNWSNAGWDHIFNNAQCAGWWTSSWSILCSPPIPLPAAASTSYVEYNVMVNTLLPQFLQAGGNVGVADAVMNDNFWPSGEYREGWAYNCEDVIGLSYIYTGYTDKANFPNCTTDTDYGYAFRPGYEYHYAAYNLPDLLTLPNARVAFTWAAANSTTMGVLNYDDIAVIVY